jgi:DNA recombination protein RmuC
MSVSELLFVLLLVCLLVGIAIVVQMVAAANRRAETQSRELAEVRAQLALGNQARDSSSAEVREVRERLGQATVVLEGVRAAVSARQQLEDDARQSLRRLEAVIAGSSTRGAAGENILEEAFRHLPPEMVQRNLWVKGKVCELGLRLPGGKLLAIDSKWTSSAELEEISLPEVEPSRRGQLATVIEKEVERRIREVSQYIDPDTTAPFALAAVPDGAYAVCRAAFAEGHRRHVLIVGYSMALPYLLALYQMHLQFARSVDMENLQACMMEVERQLDSLESTLENKLQRALTMLGNTYTDGKQSLARIRASVHSIQAMERLSEPEGPSLALVEGAELLLPRPARRR